VIAGAPADTAALATSAGDALAVRLARRGLLAALDRLRSGTVQVVERGRSVRLGAAAAGAPSATIEVHDPSFWVAAATGGSLGAAESYARSEWDADDLTLLIRLLARDREALAALDRGLSRLRVPLLRLLHAARRNTRRGSRRNIEAHYDLGNDFFGAFLDPTLTYSAAIFPREGASLEEAAEHKLDVVCRKLGLEPGMEVLEVGTGWGALAMRMAERHGCRVTTTTVSPAQHAAARDRIRAAGLEGRVTLLADDYRDLPRLGRRFDRVVSIEMIEAVGHEFLGAYFRTIDRSLRPGGRALVQAIVIRDQDEAAYRRGVDFIQRWIFPGGALPSVRGMCDAVADATSLRVAGLDDLTSHYPPTLRAWRARFEANRERIRALGFDEAFLRLWRWYFCYCEAGFLERTCGLVHLALDAPEH